MEPASRQAKSKTLVGGAVVALILACGGGIAAVMGWVPYPGSGGAENGLAGAPAVEPADPRQQAVAGAAVGSGDGSDGRASDVAPACGRCGVVETVTTVLLPGEATGLAPMTGAVAGDRFGRGSARTALGVLGAVGGAYAPHPLARGGTQYRVTVRMDDGSRRVVYAPARPGIGDRVRILNGFLLAQG